MTRAVVAFALVLAVRSAAAQTRPSFAGQWVRLADSADARPAPATTGNAAFRRGDPGTGWGTPLTITQTAESLAAAWPHFAAYDLQPPLRFAFALDGSVSANDLMIGHATVRQMARAAWRGDTLVIVTRQAAPGSSRSADSVEVRRTLALEAADRLVLEVSRGGAPTARAVYLRR